uniref:ARAD1D24222p n=1 Tax=Blastobotrys adeninivorans TaxID=409370 RepID=A0A060TFL7_BLAAD
MLHQEQVVELQDLRDEGHLGSVGRSMGQSTRQSIGQSGSDRSYTSDRDPEAAESAIDHGTDLGDPGSSFGPDSHSGPSDGIPVVQIVDDAASSVCIDDYEVEYDNAMAVLRNGNSSNQELTDFELYNQRVARQVLVRERVQRRKRINGLRQVRIGSKQYANYFSPDPDDTADTGGADTYTPSHVLDSFNGRRQNQSYNRQLNIINGPFTYQGSQTRDVRSTIDEEGGQGVNAIQPSDEMSFVTMDVDMLDSDNEALLEDDEDDDDVDTELPHYYESKKPKLKRGLRARHVRVMAIGAGYGVGILLDTGLMLFICGPLGTLLGILAFGITMMCTTSCLGEMMSLVPTEMGLPDLMSRFVDKSFGFIIGLSYWACCTMALPAEITAASMMMTYFPELASPENNIIVWVTFFLAITCFSGVLHVRSFGQLQFVAGLILMILMIVYMILMIVLNVGSLGTQSSQLGFRYWTSSKSDYENGYIFGPFRPLFLLGFDAQDDGTLKSYGIGGNTGRFVQFVYAYTQAVFPFVGSEAAFMTVGEVRNPRKSLPAVTRRIFVRIIVFYCLAVFLVSLNVYAGDGRLAGLAYQIVSNNIPEDGQAVFPGGKGGCLSGHVAWNAYMGDSNSSPWIIAVQTVGECTLAAMMNGSFVAFALLAAISYLYAGSRTLYALSMSGAVPKMFSRCTDEGIPYVSVLFTSLFCLLSYLTVSQNATVVFAWLRALTTSAALIVYSGICLAFIRFFRALKLRQDITSSRRKDELYPYKSPFQPYTAYYGLATNFLLLIISGFNLFLRDQWGASQFISAYLYVFAAIIGYLVHRYITKSRLVPLRRMDLDTGRKELDRVGWEEDRVYSRSIMERLHHFLRRIKKD